MTKLFTRSGDEGMTDFLGEGRLSKHDLRIESVGSVDEANAALGFARAASQNNEVKAWLVDIQRDLYGLMAELSASPENAQKFFSIRSEKITELEDLITTIHNQIKLPSEFIVPGDSLASAGIDLARVAVRRAERRVSELSSHNEITNPNLLPYLNRLSSLCFALELFELQKGGKDKPTLAKKRAK
jgi:cob(I)alamin adenosyltransferase